MVAWVPIAIAAASTVGSMLSKADEQKITQEMSPQQKEAFKQMLEAAKTGKLGGAQLGEGYGGSLGSYGMTDLESTGQNRLMDLIKNPSVMSELFNTGKGEITNLLSGGTYDPYNEKGIYSGFKKNVKRELGESTDELKRNAAVGGNLYSRDTVNRVGDLHERGQDMLTNKLAELYQNYGNQRINAANTALTAGTNETGMLNNMIGASQQYGGLGRHLQDVKAKDVYAEWNRARNERIGTSKDLLMSMGTSSVGASTTTPVTSPWQNLFSAGASWGFGQMGQNYANTGKFW